MPTGYQSELMPTNKHLICEMGSYDLKVSSDGAIVKLERTLTMKDGLYPKESYEQMVAFYKNVNMADATKCVLLKN